MESTNQESDTLGSGELGLRWRERNDSMLLYKWRHAIRFLNQQERERERKEDREREQKQERTRKMTDKTKSKKQKAESRKQKGLRLMSQHTRTLPKNGERRHRVKGFGESCNECVDRPRTPEPAARVTQQTVWE
jgi:FKBP-type peptidyl-prolyl cis-trans isomerase